MLWNVIAQAWKLKKRTSQFGCYVGGSDRSHDGSFLEFGATWGQWYVLRVRCQDSDPKRKRTLTERDLNGNPKPETPSIQ